MTGNKRAKITQPFDTSGPRKVQGKDKKNGALYQQQDQDRKRIVPIKADAGQINATLTTTPSA